MTLDGGMHVIIFFACRDIYLMPRMKFGSDTMLNISNGMCDTMLCMLDWMQKEKHKIGTL